MKNKDNRFVIVLKEGNSLKDEGLRQILVDKETGVTFFRFASATPFTSLSGSVLVYNLDIIVIFIIVDHPVELQGYDTFDDIFLIQPF